MKLINPPNIQKNPDAHKPPNAKVEAAIEAKLRHETFLLDYVELTIMTLHLTLMVCC